MTIRSLLLGLVVLAVACSEKPAEPAGPRTFVVTPAEATIDLADTVAFVTDKAVRSSDVSFMIANPSVVKNCPSSTIGPLVFCALAAGNTAITFTAADGRTANSTVTVRSARWVVTADGPLVAAHSQIVRARYTGAGQPRVAFRVKDTTMAFIGGIPYDGAQNSVNLFFRRAGALDVEVFDAVDTTRAFVSVATLTIDAQRPTQLTASSQNVVDGLAKIVVPVAVLDQLGTVLTDPLPTATIVEGNAVARVTAISRGDLWSNTALIEIQPVAATTATLRVSLGTLSKDVPVTARSVARDSVVVFAEGGTVDIVANDAPLDGPPVVFTQPRNGTASLSSGVVRYVPNPGFIGLDSVRYWARSGARTDTSSVRFVTMPGPFDAKVIATGEILGADINDRGDVVGTITRSDGTRRAFRWMSGRLETLEFNGVDTEASGVDSVGNAVGWGIMPITEGNFSQPMSVLWRSDTQVGEALLDRSPSGTADRPRISRSGIIAVLPDYQNITVIRGAQRETFSCDWCALAGVNDRGDVLYRSTIPSNGSASIRYAAGNRVEIAGAYHTPASGRWLRNDGTALVYQASSSGFGRTGPLVYTPAGVRYLVPTFGDWMGDVYRLTGDGWILGTANTAPSVVAPVLFIKDAGAQLSKLVTPGATVLSAFAMNEAGQILASVIDPSAGKQLVVYTARKR